MTLLLFALVLTSWVGVQADIGLTLSRQYLPANQATNGPPDRQYLPASQDETPSGSFGSTNQFDSARFDDEDSVSVISAQFVGARTAQGTSSRRQQNGQTNPNSISGPSSRIATGSFSQNGYSGSTNRFSGVPSNQYGAPLASSRSGGFNSNQLGRSEGYSNQNRVGNRIDDAPSNQYGTPASSGRFSGTPSSQYGAPRAFSRFGQNGASSASGRFGGVPSNQYGVPEASVRSGTSYQNGRSGPSNGFSSAPSNQYGAPANNGLIRSGSASPSRQYGAPGGFSRNIGGAVSGQNGAISATGRTSSPLSTQYGVPSASSRSSDIPSGQYGAPSASSRFGGVASSTTSGTSNNFGGSAASARYATPGATNRYSGNAQGYEYNAAGAGLRNANGGGFDNEDALSEPANYEFSYEVEARDYGTEFGHEESRQYDYAHGSYHVLLPDGRTQVVEYEADQDGYKPQIRYEGETGTSGRAADGSGPY